MKPLLLAVLALALAAPQVSSAPVSCGRYGDDFDLGCSVDNGQGGEDILVVRGPAGVERISVVCGSTTSPWKSHGPNTPEYVNSIVLSWCSQ